MDGITPDMSAASPDIASPSEAATSAVASEAVGAEQTLPVDTQNAVSSGIRQPRNRKLTSRMMPRCSKCLQPNDRATGNNYALRMRLQSLTPKPTRNTKTPLPTLSKSAALSDSSNRPNSARCSFHHREPGNRTSGTDRRPVYRALGERFSRDAWRNRMEGTQPAVTVES